MSTISNVLKVHPADNVLVALTNLGKGAVVSFEGVEYTIAENVKAKHKFATVDLAPGDPITMYGVLVGKAQQPIPKGGLISTTNVKHATNDFTIGERHTDWVVPDVTAFRNRTSSGSHRPDG